MRQGKFREDLFYRLSTVPIKVPALRERRDDIYLLFRKFVNDFSVKNRIDTIKLDERAQLVLENYSWPGNIRELKNIAERLCVLSQERLINAEMLFELESKLFDRNLPKGAGAQKSSSGTTASGSSFEEREILYKLLFDMKADLNDLKKLIFELVKRNDLTMPEFDSFSRLQIGLPAVTTQNEHASTGSWRTAPDEESSAYQDMEYSNRPEIIIEQPIMAARREAVIEAKESPITMEEIEKEAIKRTLKKYHGRRKEAAEELKISERTLYRKIKEYHLD